MGYGFKSFYVNGKMSLQVYIDQILEPVVKPWLSEKQDFALEEDGDSGHGRAKNRIIEAGTGV